RGGTCSSRSSRGRASSAARRPSPRRSRCGRDRDREHRRRGPAGRRGPPDGSRSARTPRDAKSTPSSFPSGELGSHVARETLHVLEHRAQLRHGRDRKSTRLNSSHVSISYAVFCLKKKKNNQYAHTTRKLTNPAT